MKPPNGPFLLEDYNRLKEIQDLRVLCWDTATNLTMQEKSILSKILNDELDLKSHHWYYSFDNKIVASARLSKVFDYSTLPYPEIFKFFTLPVERPFYLISRLVVHPDFRSKGLTRELDLVRMNYINDNPEKWAMATSEYRRKIKLEKHGFISLGLIPYNNHTYPFEHSYFMINILK